MLPHALFAGGLTVAAFSVAHHFVKKRRNAQQQQQQPRQLSEEAKRRRLAQAQNTLFAIIGINVGIFLLWNAPGRHRAQFLIPYFTHSVYSPPISMLGAVFSHQNLAHLAFNSIALYSFGTSVAMLLGYEQFLALYVGAGVCSAAASHFVKRHVRPSALPSIGASGAIFAVLTAQTYMNPHTGVSIILLPFIHFEAWQLLPLVSLLDLTGLLLGWRRFDHTAHLAGALFGILFMMFVCQVYGLDIQQIRQALHKNK